MNDDAFKVFREKTEERLRMAKEHNDFKKRLKQKSIRVYFRDDISGGTYKQIIRSICNEEYVDSVVELDTWVELFKDISYQLGNVRNEIKERS